MSESKSISNDKKKKVAVIKKKVEKKEKGNKVSKKRSKKSDKPSENKFNKRDKINQQQETIEKELEEISKSSFARILESNKIDRYSHLRADKKPFIND